MSMRGALCARDPAITMAMTLGMALGLTVCTARSVDAQVVGYHQLGGSTVHPAPVVIDAGGLAVEIDAIDDESVRGLDILWLHESTVDDGELPISRAAMRTLHGWIHAGGTLVVHDGTAPRMTRVLPGAGARVEGVNATVGEEAGRGTLVDADLETNPLSIARGPFGDLRGAEIWHGGYVAAESLPPESVSVLLRAGDPDRVAAFAYPFGRGLVYYSTASRRGLTLGRSFEEPLRTLTRNLFARLFTRPALSRDTDEDGVPDSIEERLGLDPLDPDDGESDDDEDGLTAREEVWIGTDPALADSDHDGVSDGMEELSLRTDPLYWDTDDDGTFDDDDASPAVPVLIRLRAPEVAIAGRETRVRVEAVRRDGRPALISAEVALHASAPARWEPASGRDPIVDGDGTASVRVALERGVAELALLADEPAAVEVRVDTGDDPGLVASTEWATRLDGSDGGFTVAELSLGDPVAWQWGTPRSGPRGGWTGDRAWGTGISADGYQPGASGALESPAFEVPTSGPAVLRYVQWFAGSSQEDRRIEYSLDGGEWLELDRSPIELWHTWELRQIGLTQWAGRVVRLRFRFEAGRGRTTRASGWFVDDFRLLGSARTTLQLLAPDADSDGDGLRADDELAAGTNPLSGDSDGDGIGDDAETDTGVTVDGTDTGTSPRLRDSDGGGSPDGRELTLGTDPFDPSDDHGALYQGSFEIDDAGGVPWKTFGGASFTANERDLFERGVTWEVDRGAPSSGLTLVSRDRQSYVASDFGWVESSALRSSRQTFIPSSGEAFLRVIDLLRNPTDSASSTHVVHSVRFHIDEPTASTITSSGDALLDATDQWLVHGGSESGQRFAFIVFWGAGASDRPVESSFDRGSVDWEWNVEIPPGDTIALVTFVGHARTRPLAIQAARQLAALGGRATEALQARIARTVRNADMTSPTSSLPEFRRGDANADGRVDISDAIVALGYLFLGDDEPSCLDAADANDDGNVDIADPTRIVSYLFTGGAQLPWPRSDACGLDLTLDDAAATGGTGDLGCASFAPCQ